MLWLLLCVTAVAPVSNVSHWWGDCDMCSLPILLHCILVTR